MADARDAEAARQLVGHLTSWLAGASFSVEELRKLYDSIHEQAAEPAAGKSKECLAEELASAPLDKSGHLPVLHKHGVDKAKLGVLFEKHLKRPPGKKAEDVKQLESIVAAAADEDGQEDAAAFRSRFPEPPANSPKPKAEPKPAEPKPKHHAEPKPKHEEPGYLDTAAYRKPITRSLKDAVWKHRSDNDDYRNVVRGFEHEEVDHVVELQVVRDMVERLRPSGAHASAARDAIVRGLHDSCMNEVQNLNVTNMEVNRSKRWAVDTFLKHYHAGEPVSLIDALNERGDAGHWSRADSARIAKETWASQHFIVDTLPNAVGAQHAGAAEEYLSALQHAVVAMELR